jgi:hypothetical protein
MSDIKVQETTEYESCLDFESDDINDVSKFMDGEETQEEKLPIVEVDDSLLTRDQFFKKYWKGMPTFDQNDNPPWKQLYVNFRNEEDYQAFAKLIDQALSDKSKSIWNPKLDVEENSLNRWIVE